MTVEIVSLTRTKEWTLLVMFCNWQGIETVVKVGETPADLQYVAQICKGKNIPVVKVVSEESKPSMVGFYAFYDWLKITGRLLI